MGYEGLLLIVLLGVGFFFIVSEGLMQGELPIKLDGISTNFLVIACAVVILAVFMMGWIYATH